MDKTVKKMPLATSIISSINVAIFLTAFVFPGIAVGLAISVFIIFILLRLVGKIFTDKLVAFISEIHETTDKIEDDAEREKQHIDNAVWFLIIVFLASIFLLPIYQKWRSRLFGLLFSSLMSIVVITYSNLWDIGQNLSIFLHVISVYTFIRLLVRFTLNPLGESIALNKVSNMLKIALELARIFFIALAVMGRDNTLALNWMPPSILETVVATIAIDTIIATIEKFVHKPESLEIPREIEDKSTVYEVISEDET